MTPVLFSPLDRAVLLVKRDHTLGTILERLRAALDREVARRHLHLGRHAAHEVHEVARLCRTASRREFLQRRNRSALP